ncbi:hypothetical protein LZ198_33180 [Myxococcus sp. K15C18031901]|uniref:hypothetical protein n=1 Tax=Myxococcus dinghuensis TaxID=2906761 RepID=UPI0020A7A24E|nr:hypothetical protein [Myxococcus dinghuensis]MCP3103748.1 hypothetical protein [Myxococcus dinghuensis]
MMLQRPLITVAGGMLVLLVACAGGLGYVRARTVALSDRLVGEVQALSRARHVRPPHVLSPMSGSFAHHAEPLMDAVVGLYRARPRARGGAEWLTEQPCQDEVDAGQQATTALSESCHAELELGREVLARALLATHAEEGGLPASMGVFAPMDHPHAAEGKVALVYLVHLAAMETRLRLEQGQASEAVDTCLDGLALARELEQGGGLEGHMLAATGQGLVYRPCADALDRAPVERKRLALVQLRRLAEGFTPFSVTLRHESLVLQLFHFQPLMTDEALAALPKESLELFPRELREMEEHSSSPLEFRRAWWKTVEVFDALVEAADLPAAARQRAFTRIADWDDGWLGPVDGPEVGNYAGYAERLDLRRMRHDALVTLTEVDLARAERGHWPEMAPRQQDSAFVLEPTSSIEARLRPCSRSLSEYSLHVTADTAPAPRALAP